MKDRKKLLDEHRSINAVAESTIGSVKAELLEDWIPASQRELTRELFRYIEAFYNKCRLHSTLGYRAPNDVENDFVDRNFERRVA